MLPSPWIGWVGYTHGVMHARAVARATSLALLVAVMVSPPAAGQGARIEVELIEEADNIGIEGTNNADLVFATTVNDWVVVLTIDRVGVRLSQFRQDTVDLIAVDAHGGGDVVLIDHDIQTIVDLRDGDDIFVGGPGDDNVRADDGRDVVYARDGGGTFSGGSMADILVGGAGGDRIAGDGGDDALNGNGGDDTIRGGDDDDLVVGAAGVDHLEGRDGDDFLVGGPGDDELFGGDHDDVLCGGIDNDYLGGGRGDDHLFGEEQADEHDGDNGNDELYGDPAVGDTFANGNVNVGDYICDFDSAVDPPAVEVSNDVTAFAYSGYVYISGGEGADSIEVTANGATVSATVTREGAAPVSIAAEILEGPPTALIVGGAGDDEIRLAGEFAAVIVDAGSGNDTLRADEAIYAIGVILGDSGDDILAVGGVRNLVAAGAGDDRVSGGGGTDYISAAPGDDVVEVGESDYVLEEHLRGDGLALIVSIALALAAALLWVALRFARRRG